MSVRLLGLVLARADVEGKVCLRDTKSLLQGKLSRTFLPNARNDSAKIELGDWPIRSEVLIMSARAPSSGQNLTMARHGLPSLQFSQSAPSSLVHKSSSKQPLRTYSKRPLQDTSLPLSKRQRIDHPTLPVQITAKSGERLPVSAPSISVHKSSSTPQQRTYSKGIHQDTSGLPNKRQRIEHLTLPVQSTTNSGVPPTTPPLSKKRSIAYYFKPVALPKAPSSPQSPIFSSDPVQNVESSPPSSPPSPGIFSSTVPLKKRARRRLVARRPLELINMSDLNTGGSKEHENGNSKAIGMHDYIVHSIPVSEYLLTVADTRRPISFRRLISYP
jgi:hypothetical protein